MIRKKHGVLVAAWLVFLFAQDGAAVTKFLTKPTLAPTFKAKGMDPH